MMRLLVLALLLSCGASDVPESQEPVEPATSATTGSEGPVPVGGPSECSAPVTAICEAEQPWDPRPVEKIRIRSQIQ